MNIKACIFDLDGVIVDTAKHHLTAWNRLANLFDYELSYKDNEKLKGVSRMASLDIILDLAGISISDDKKLDFANMKNGWYIESVSEIDAAEILPGVNSFLEELILNNIKIGLGSASKNARLILDRIGLLNKFEVIIDGNLVSKSKPNPEVFLKGSEALNIKPQACIVFEDSIKGIEAAVIGGFKTIGIGNSTDLPIADFVLPGFEDFSFEKLEGLFRH